jgi:hypothetical protein
MSTPEDQFYEVLKAAEKTPNDAGQMVRSEATELYEEQDDMPAPTSMDASIGNRDRPRSSVLLAQSVLKAIHDGRERLLDEIFDEKGKSDAVEQKLIAGRFTHGASGDFETSSPQLAEKSKLKIAEVPPTLGDLVMRNIGRR